MDSGVILLIFLALLTAWAINWVLRKLRLPPLARGGIVIVFILVMAAMYGQQFRP